MIALDIPEDAVSVLTLDEVWRHLVEHDGAPTGALKRLYLEGGTLVAVLHDREMRFTLQDLQDSLWGFTYVTWARQGTEDVLAGFG